jgi:hypothetical protein
MDYAENRSMPSAGQSQSIQCDNQDRPIEQYFGRFGLA